MKLTIFAATGGIGRRPRAGAAAGHDVTAVVRDPSDAAGHGARSSPPTSRADAAALVAAVAGADAVLSGLGAAHEIRRGITSRGTRAIVHGDAGDRLRRLVVVSAAPIGTVPSPGRPDPPKHDAGDGFFMRHLAAPFAQTTFRTTTPTSR